MAAAAACSTSARAVMCDGIRSGAPLANIPPGRIGTVIGAMLATRRAAALWAAPDSTPPNGTATGALNFVRQLGGTITVAAFGAIVLGGIDTGGRGLTLDMLHGGAGVAGADLVAVFRWLFAAGAALLAVGLVAVLAIEERPLRGPQQETPAETGRIAAE